MLVRGTAPVVKAWPAMTIGSSDKTGSTFSDLSLRRSSAGLKSAKLPSGWRERRWQKTSSPPV